DESRSGAVRHAVARVRTRHAAPAAAHRRINCSAVQPSTAAPAPAGAAVPQRPRKPARAAAKASVPGQRINTTTDPRSRQHGDRRIHTDSTPTRVAQSSRARHGATHKEHDMAVKITQKLKGYTV